MMSLATIHDLAERQARKARKQKLQPFLVLRSDLEAWRKAHEAGEPVRLPFPNIGSYRPRGYRVVRRLFVDKSGFGQAWEPAMNLSQLLTEQRRGSRHAEPGLQPGHYYAIT